MCDTAPMNEVTAAPDYKRHRFPPEIIGHAVWLYFRFALSYRDVEELLAERGVILTYETVRQWCRKFGQAYANTLRRRRPRPGDKWHLDEVFIQINGVSGNKGRGCRVARHDRVVPLAVERVALELEGRHLGVRNLAPGGVGVGIQIALDG